MINIRTLFTCCILLSSACYFAASAEEKGSITGVFHTDNPKITSIQIAGSNKIIHPDKKGRFSIKNVKLNEDILEVFAPNYKDTVKIELVGLPIIRLEETSDYLDVQMKPRPIVPETMYGGTVIMQADLEKTGELNTLKAVNIKYPQSPLTSLNGSMAPLYFIDGLEVTDISHVLIKETAYVEVVRPSNPACSSLGSRGGNGLILITTDTKFKSSLRANEQPEERHWQIPLSK